jgi:transposase
MQKLSIPNYSVEDLEKLLNSNTDYVIGMRLAALIQIKKGMSSRQLQEFYYKSHSRFCVWVSNFNIYGVDGLVNKVKSGRKPLLNEVQKKELYNVLLNNRPSDFDYNTATWNGPILKDFIKKKYGIEYKKAQVYNILKSLGFTFQKARGKYPEADEEKRNQFKEILKKTEGRT